MLKQGYQIVYFHIGSDGPLSFILTSDTMCTDHHGGLRNEGINKELSILLSANSITGVTRWQNRGYAK
ncbi:hypothetical protein P8452_66923 [Trifolium repens]|nr:hypothetical protein P8452_66923 [Trifolium repens]